jgi:hypothetical protein
MRGTDIVGGGSIAWPVCSWACENTEELFDLKGLAFGWEARTQRGRRIDLRSVTTQDPWIHVVQVTDADAEVLITGFMKPVIAITAP